MASADKSDENRANVPSGNSKKKKGKKTRPKKTIDTRAGNGDGYRDELAADQQPSPSPHDDSYHENPSAFDQGSESGSMIPMNDGKETEQPEQPDCVSASVSTEPSQSNGHAQVLSSLNGQSVSADYTAEVTRGISHHDASTKLEIMSKEQEALHTELEQLRRQLENIQQLHSTEVTKLKLDLQESEAAKTEAEQQYQTLLERVEKIKSTLGERLKRDRAKLEEANLRIEELEAQNEQLYKSGCSHEGSIAVLKNDLFEANQELTGLRNRYSALQQSWTKEKDDLARQLKHFRSELESTSSAMHEWEVIATEERQGRENLGEKVADLEDQLTTLREAHDRAAEERDSSLQTIDGLQRALQEIQDARRKELRDLVESSEEQLQEMMIKVEDADKRAAEAEAAKTFLSQELERTAPFEKEVREKNLLIGKLRHEAIVLNDHLTKALRYLKRSKPDEQVDRQIITNHLLQFLSIDRSDPKRFQILQVIAGYLAWTDEQKEQAGLARPGASHNSLRLPASPFHRTPSNVSLSTEFLSTVSSNAGKESLADLWADFHQRSADEGRSVEITGPSSRKDSVASSIGAAYTVPKSDGMG